MKLQELIQDLNPKATFIDREITGLCLHSQQLQSGELFIALKGHPYIQEAIAKGAAAVLCGDHLHTMEINSMVPIITIPALGEKLKTLATRFYGELNELSVIGVTGTNGKTTTSYILAQALTRLGISCGLIGTLGYGFVKELNFSGLTTPDIISLQKYCKKIKSQGANVIAMEVSSHGLDQGRTQNIPFESAIFTNLTQDHLDYHGNIEHYGKAKQKLFQMKSVQRAIINADAHYAQQILHAVPVNTPIMLCSIHPTMGVELTQRPTIRKMTVESYHLDHKGITATVQTPNSKGILRSSLLGAFNLSNLLLVLAELLMRNIPLADALDALAHAQAAPGRMQRLGGASTTQIIIDYAHTPDALENALLATRHHCRRRLWCVFGCGGDRDKTKRSQMGYIAAKLADKVVLTSDNPRTEDPYQIIQNIWQGVSQEHHHKMIVEEDRQKAIEYAMTHALPVDTILIAGKGHEDYQIIGEKKYPFSDEKCVKALLGEAHE